MTSLHNEPNDRRADWEATSALLDLFKDDPADIIAFIDHCSGDDLHSFNHIHGVASEVEVYRTILNHPDCDRSIALDIYQACDPYYYEQEFTKGRKRSDFDDEEELTFLSILDIAHEVLTARPNWQGKFDSAALKHWRAYPDQSPAHFDHWPLPAAVLAPTDRKVPKPSVTYCFSTIRLTYETWSRRQ